MSKKDNPFLGEHGVDKNENWMRVGAVSGKVRMEHEGLRGDIMWYGEGLNEFY